MTSAFVAMRGTAQREKTNLNIHQHCSTMLVLFLPRCAHQAACTAAQHQPQTGLCHQQLQACIMSRTCVCDAHPSSMLLHGGAQSSAASGHRAAPNRDCALRLSCC